MEVTPTDRHENIGRASYQLWVSVIRQCISKIVHVSRLINLMDEKVMGRF
jgi:hypothetical protein